MLIDPAFVKVLRAVTYACKCCGKKESVEPTAKGEIYAYAKEHQLCYTCAYWEKICLMDRATFLIVDGICYMAKPKTLKDECLCNTYNGKTFYAIILKTKRMVCTNHLVRIGKVPPQFKERLPDNAIFITLRTFIKLTADNFVCYAQGCYDRYRCLRYNCEAEETPFNTVPKSHCIGDECCPQCIDKLQQQYGKQKITAEIKPRVKPVRQNGLLGKFTDEGNINDSPIDWLHL